MGLDAGPASRQQQQQQQPAPRRVVLKLFSGDQTVDFPCLVSQCGQGVGAEDATLLAALDAGLLVEKTPW